MENKIEYGKIAAKLTLASVISAALFAVIGGLALGLMKLELDKTTSIVIVSLLAIVGMYFSVSWYLKRNCRKWNIALVKEDGGARNFAGIAFAALMFGLYWRTLLIGIVTGAISAMLKGMYGEHLTTVTGFGVDTLASILNFYVGFYWLLKAQYGSFKIVKLGSDLFRNAVIEQGSTTLADAKTSIKDTLTGVLGTVAVLSFYGLGVVQIFATYDFFRHYWDWNWFGSFIAAMFVGYTPILGSVSGVIAATKVWGWDLWAAMLLFFYPYAIYIVIGILGGTVSLLGGLFGSRK